MSQYVRQWIVYLSDDLHNTALALSQKKGDDNESRPVTLGGVLHYKPGEATIKLGSTDEPGNGRLIVVGHGSEGAGLFGKYIGDNLEPRALATLIHDWLGGNRIERISLHMCWGAGTEGFYKNVSPQDSFAFKLASYCGKMAKSVTARPGKLSVYWGGPTLVGGIRTGEVEHDVTNPDYGRRRIAMKLKPGKNDWRPVESKDVWVFTPDPNSSPENAIIPKYIKKSDLE